MATGGMGRTENTGNAYTYNPNWCGNILPCGWCKELGMMCPLEGATYHNQPYPKPMKWIPVSERLPENDKTVLVWDRRNSREYFDVYDHGSWIILESEDITHWMPLPEPPKEETDG